MDIVFTHCAGLDVHKKSVMACRMTPDPTGQQAEGFLEVQEFGTLMVDLLALSDWLAEAGITHVAMESTGEYWKPVSNLLEGSFQVPLSQQRRTDHRKRLRELGVQQCASHLAEGLRFRPTVELRGAPVPENNTVV
jgi:hypothetical protein